MGILIAILIFSFVVFIHELGHFLVGLKLGAEPVEFSIGFGKPLFQKEIKGINYKLGGIPFGGYVKFKKDANHPDPSLRISHGKGILVYLAGPVANLLLSYVMLFFLILGAGVVSQNKFSEKLLEDVRIEQELSSNIVLSSLTVTNQLVKKGATGTINYLSNHWKAENIVTESAGPVGITNQINETYNKGSWVHLYLFTMLLSISLGITNLLPLGVLDGGRIFSSFLKMIFNEQKVEPLISFYDKISIICILGFVAVVTIKDLFEIIIKSSGN